MRFQIKKKIIRFLVYNFIQRFSVQTGEKLFSAERLQTAQEFVQMFRNKNGFCGS